MVNLDIHTLKRETSLNLDIVANSVGVGQNSLPYDRTKHANLIYMEKALASGILIGQSNIIVSNLQTTQITYLAKD